MDRFLLPHVSLKPGLIVERFSDFDRTRPYGHQGKLRLCNKEAASTILLDLVTPISLPLSYDHCTGYC